MTELERAVAEGIATLRRIAAKLAATDMIGSVAVGLVADRLDRALREAAP